MFRIKKIATYVYSAQQGKNPILEITSNMEIGDIAGGQLGDFYLITNCDKVVLNKNNKKIAKYIIKEERKHSETKNLPHPLIKINDLIGNQIIQSGRFKKRDAIKLKKVVYYKYMKSFSRDLKRSKKEFFYEKIIIK